MVSTFLYSIALDIACLGLVFCGIALVKNWNNKKTDLISPIMVALSISNVIYFGSALLLEMKHKNELRWQQESLVIPPVVSK